MQSRGAFYIYSHVKFTNLCLLENSECVSKKKKAIFLNFVVFSLCDLLDYYPLLKQHLMNFGRKGPTGTVLKNL